MYLDKSNSMLKNFIKYSFIALCLSFFTNNLSAFEQVKEPMLNGEKFAWSEEEKKWITSESFWKENNLNNINKEHKAFKEKEEFYDLFSLKDNRDIEPCLMEYFQTRWKREKDIKFWDDTYNSSQDCGGVFK